MVSTSSKALPYVSIAVGFIMAVLAILGYNEELESVIGVLGVILPITAGGGLINKQIEVSLEKKKLLLEEGNLEKLVKKVIAESKK